MLLPFCIFESSCVTVTMKVLLGIVIDFFIFCAKTWKIVADFVLLHFAAFWDTTLVKYLVLAAFLFFFLWGSKE